MCKTQYQTDILIIGGGASGLAAAIEIKRINPDLNVIIAERLLKTGKKILTSGNGRCNLGNININEDFFHGSVKNKMDIINQTENTETFFNSIGLICTADDCGRMYPYSNTASSVLNCMRNNIIENNVTELCGCEVKEIKKNKNIFIVSGDNFEITSRAVIVSAGGYAAPSMGTDGSIIRILKKAGHKTAKISPANAPLKVNPTDLKGLKGVRIRGKASAYSDGKKLDEEYGEIQFNENAVSGICIFNLSYLYSEHENDFSVSLDLTPDKSFAELIDILSELRKINEHNTAENYLTGFFNKNMAHYLIKRTGKGLNESISGMNGRYIKQLAAIIKSLDFKVTGSSSWQNAQVTHGGIHGQSIDSKLQSVIYKGMFFSGEILDVDGICGGYNLTWAWSSGIWAAKNAVEYLGG